MGRIDEGLRSLKIGQQFYTYLREEPRDKQSPWAVKLHDKVLINCRWAWGVGGFNGFEEDGWS
jgi:hypothetical protein